MILSGVVNSRERQVALNPAPGTEGQSGKLRFQSGWEDLESAGPVSDTPRVARCSSQGASALQIEEDSDGIRKKV